MVMLRRQDLPPAQPAVVTTSRYFATLLAQELALPADALREVGENSEFDFFVDYLAKLPPPRAFTAPAGWTIDDPRGQ